MPKPAKGIEFINELIDCIDKERNYFDSLNGKKIDTSKEKTFSPGPFLHESTDELSETESAQFELDNKKAFGWLVDLREKIFEHLRPLE